MAPVRAPEGSSYEDSCGFPRGYDRNQLSPREIITRQEDAYFATPFCDLLASWTEEGNGYNCS